MSWLKKVFLTPVCQCLSPWVLDSAENQNHVCVAHCGMNVHWLHGVCGLHGALEEGQAQVLPPQGSQRQWATPDSCPHTSKNPWWGWRLAHSDVMAQTWGQLVSTNVASLLCCNSTESLMINCSICLWDTSHCQSDTLLMGKLHSAYEFNVHVHKFSTIWSVWY